MKYEFGHCYQSHKIQVNDYVLRTVLFQDRQHIVVPVIMMVEGVHNGSAGRLFHSSEELSKCLPAWNGIPISIQHPMEDGNFISANQPGVIDSQVVGQVFHSTFDNGRLRAEAYLDETKLRQVSPEMYDNLQNCRPIEVSVGVFTDDEMISGTWNNEEYVAIAKNHKPDHLALLIGQAGACSIEDGCGIRANKEGGEQGVKNIRVVVCETGFRERIGLIQGKLDVLDDDSKMHYLQEVYADHFIYAVQQKGGADVLFRRNYQMNAGQDIEFTDGSINVIKKVEYVVQTENSNPKGGGIIMGGEKKKDCPECPTIVKALIANPLTGYAAVDEAMLLEIGNDLGEDFLKSMIPVNVPVVNAEEEKKAEEKKVEVKIAESTPAAMTKADALKVLQDELSDDTKLLELVSPAMRNQLEHGRKLHEEQRGVLVANIVKNQKIKVYTEELLKDVKTTILQNLSDAIGQPVNFSGQGAGSVERHGQDLPEVIVPVAYQKKADKE